MLTAAHIGTIGEMHTTDWLKAKNYSCTRNTKLPGATDIEANGSAISLLVQVKTAVWPSLAASLTAEEKKAIVVKNQRQAWLAQLQINSKGQLVGDIVWTKLN